MAIKSIKPKRCRTCNRIIRSYNISGFCNYHYKLNRAKLKRAQEKLDSEVSVWGR